MANLKIDMKAWPIVITGWSGHATDSEVVAFIDGIKASVARQQPFGFICDFSVGEPMEKEQRQSLVKYTQDNRDALRRYCYATAVVTTSHMKRMVINTFSLMARAPFPMRAFSTQQEAIAWCNQLLRANANIRARIA